MDDRPPPQTRNSSRTLAVVAVAVLVVIAIAGIVLGVARDRKASPVATTALSGTQPPSSAPTAGASGATAATDEAPNQIVFEAASDTLSAKATDQIARLAEAAKKESRTVSITAKMETGSDRAERMELAKKRASAVRQKLQDNGISLGVLRVEISEYPVGLVPAREADRIVVNLR